MEKCLGTKLYRSNKWLLEEEGTRHVRKPVTPALAWVPFFICGLARFDSNGLQAIISTRVIQEETSIALNTYCIGLILHLSLCSRF